MNSESQLVASGPVRSSPEEDRWLARTTEKVRSELSGSIVARVWPYRDGGKVMIICDLFDHKRGCESMTFTVGGERRFDVVDPCVVDAAEALHMIGELCRAVDAIVRLGH